VSIELLERAARALEPVLGDVVFLGGASLVLWITDSAAPAPRPTKDVDVVVEVTSRSAFHAFEERLRSLGFREDQEEGIICRWRHQNGDLILDAMPSDAAILGFENRWQGASIPHAVERTLPSGLRIRAAPPAYLLATKIEAFNGRGREDFLGSRDFGGATAGREGRLLPGGADLVWTQCARRECCGRRDAAGPGASGRLDGGECPRAHDPESDAAGVRHSRGQAPDRSEERDRVYRPPRVAERSERR